jgi:hypothetical protein
VKKYRLVTAFTILSALWRINGYRGDVITLPRAIAPGDTLEITKHSEINPKIDKKI